MKQTHFIVRILTIVMLSFLVHLELLAVLPVGSDTIPIMNLNDQLPLLKKYVAIRAEGDIIIDGKAEDSSWITAPYTDEFIDIAGGSTPHYSTKCKMLWDDDYFYIYAKLEEPHISANITKHDTVIFYDNDFEVFIDPSDDTYNYIEIEINANNVIWDLYLDRPYRSGGRPINSFEALGIEHAVSIDGSLNDGTDIDSFWAIEMAIPLKVVMEVGPRRKKSLQAGDYWRVNYSRVQWRQEFDVNEYKRLRNKRGELLDEFNWVWSEQMTINMHQPEFWGFVFFADENNHDFDSAFSLPDDLLDRQIGYALFRNMRLQPWKQFKKEKVGYEVTIYDALVNGINYSAEFRKTRSGFEIDLINKTDNKRYVIDQLGWLKRIQ